MLLLGEKNVEIKCGKIEREKAMANFSTFYSAN